MAYEFNTGAVPGRIVWGHPLKSKPKTDPQTKQPKLSATGQPIEVWSWGVAFPKDHFNAAILPYLQAEAQTAFPNGTPQRFAWKYLDGDGVDNNGKPYSARDGYAGHIILSISTEAFAPPFYRRNNGAFVQIGPDEIKCGDYIAMTLVTKYNNATGTNTPGLYVNPVVGELVAQGEAIVGNGGADPNEKLGAVQYQMPVGAQPLGAAPMMPTAQPMMAPQPQQPMMAPQPQQPMMAPQPQQPMMAPQPQQPMPAPAHDFVQNAGVPQQPVMPGFPQQV